ncbi:hypothetical protein B9Z55_028019 [Caenorhabditis nigoni]|uniref:Uncharacterized protein n=1 Tax=Caenorhabditis nigoni TaxID=1611254 RepID=A0A2G5SDT0_9PELO|nr:hypothetical protein B9Z55_028019 [Caenorhabditis nigoni]
MGIWIWEYHIKASENLAILWHPDIWGYIMGIWIWEYHIKASENLAITLASGYMGIYHGHLDMGVPYQGIRESCDYSGIRIYGDISWASGYGSTISRHQRILRFLWHPDIWGYIKGIWIWEYHIKASENLAITLASGYMGIYQGHLDMGVPYQGIRESCDSLASGYMGYIKGIWIWEYHIKASENLAISLASGYMGIYQGHLDMGVPYQGIRESCDSLASDIWDISRASGYGSTISRHQRILRLLWHPDIWGYIKGIWIWEYHIKASENLAISLASGYMGIYQGHLDMGVPYQGIRESCDYSGIRIYGDISWASGYGSTISRHQRILRLLWHPDIWGYIMGIWIWEYHIKASENLAISLASGYMGYIKGIWIWEYHIKASENLAITLASGYMGIYQGHLDMGGIWIWEYHIKASENLAISLASGYMGYIKGICIWEYHIKASENLAISLASGYMGIYQGHLDMGVPYQGIRESCDSSGIQIYRDISRASGYGSTISRHQSILRLLWHPDIWGYIKGTWIWEYHIKASENLAISLASGYMGIYQGHLDMGVPYQGIRESCEYSGIRIYGDISRASGYGSTISRHQRILRFLWHPDIWGYIKGIWIWEYHIKASENLAITLASGYMGIYQGHLDMGVPYHWHQGILRLLWHPDIWGYIKGIWIWEYHIKASENLAITLASGYMGIYQGHLDMGVPYQGIRESCEYSGIRIYGDISRASGYGSTISRHQRILRLLWHPDIWGYIKGIWIWEYHITGIRESCDYSGIRIYGDISWASGYGSTISRHQRILRLHWHPDIWGYIKGIWIWEYHIKASENLAILWHPDIWGYIMGIWIWEYHIKASENLAITLASGYMGIYQGHLDMGAPYQGIRESCDYSGIRIYGDISRASGYGSTISLASGNLAITLASGYMGIYQGHLDMGVPYQGIRESCDYSGIRIYGDISRASGYGSTISLASGNLAITLASGYMGIYHGHLDMGVPYQGIRESCDYSGIRIYGDISRASGYGSTISLASGNLAITLASGYMGIYQGHLDMGVPYQGIRESCDYSGIRIYGDISWASGYGSTISRHQRILRLLWHPDIWGYIMGIWIWEYHIKASENLAISLASGYMGIYQGHLDMGVPYHWHQGILRLLWHPDIWGYIMGIWIWEYHIKASENLAITLASGYMGIYQGHLDMGVPYHWHQGILRLLWHPDIWGYIKGIWIWEYHIKASENLAITLASGLYGDISRASGYGSTISLASGNLAITLASGYMGIYHGHLDMGVPYQGIRESCDYTGIRICGDISRASGYGSTISLASENLAITLASGYMGIYQGHLDMGVPYHWHQGILRLLWHPDIWGYIMGIWIWKYHIKASENLAITLASGYMGIYQGHLDMGVPYHWHQGILRLLWHPDIWGYIMGIWIWEYHIKASENLAITLASGYVGIYQGHLDMGHMFALSNQEELIKECQRLAIEKIGYTIPIAKELISLDDFFKTRL